ncbi:hypothetical protein [Nocardia sp. Marseille-Q1738]
MDDEQERYKKYVIRQWFKGKRARSIENWRKESKRRGNAREFGNLFRDGMTQILGRTEDRGWKTEVYRATDQGRRYDDSAHKKLAHSMEFKAGKLGADAVRQLEKDEHGLKTGRTIEWYIAPTSTISREAADKIQELKTKYPDQFQVIVVSREQFAQAIQIGKELAKAREAQQLQIARENEIARNLEAGKQLEVKKAELRKQVEEQARQLQVARERGRAVEVEPLRAAHAKMLQDLEKIREAEREQAREMLQAAGHTPQQIKAMETVLEQGREDQRKDVV